MFLNEDEIYHEACEALDWVDPWEDPKDAVRASREALEPNKIFNRI